MPRVYVIQENRKIDISPAEEYGPIKILLPSGDANYQADETYSCLSKGLADFNVDEDFVLLTGDPTAIFMAGGILSELVYDNYSDNTDLFDGSNELRYINILKWNRKTSRYLSLKTPIVQGENHG